MQREGGGGWGEGWSRLFQIVAIARGGPNFFQDFFRVPGSQQHITIQTFLKYHPRGISSLKEIQVHQIQPAVLVQAYFGPAKAACLCSYCCNRHLRYDGGRLGRVKIVTLSERKKFARPKKTPALQVTPEKPSSHVNFKALLVRSI